MQHFRKQNIISKINIFLFKIACIALILPPFIAGCGSAINDSHRGEIVAINPKTETSIEDLSSFLRLVNAWNYLYKRLEPYSKYRVSAYSIAYRSQTANGREIIVSGLVVVPFDANGGNLSVPILSFQRPLQVKRNQSPSLQFIDNHLTVPYAFLLASTGYIVSVADYPGLGVSHDTHPFVHKSIAYSVVDLIRAARDSKLNWTDSSKNTSWDGRLYLIGYSLGGYASMAAAQELQTKHHKEFKVSAVAALSGPYSLSDTMRNIILHAGPDYNSPYVLPYMVAGYESVYSKETDAFDFSKCVKKNVSGYTGDFAADLKKTLNGDYTSNYINKFMRMITPYEGPRSILTDRFISMLNDTGSVVFEKLWENDAYRGWEPAMPMKIYHNIHDETVHVSNSLNAYAAFSFLANVSLETFSEYIYGFESVHVGAMPVSIYKGFIWLDSFAYPERH